MKQTLDDRLIKLRSLVAWYPDRWYSWWETHYPLLDEMVEEGYLDRCILYPQMTRWYRATEFGKEQFWAWVERLNRE